MAAALQNSQTLQNLMRAFAGESQARNRYTFAAAFCRQQQFHVLDAVFTFTANQEKEHAEIFYNHMKEASGQKVSIQADYPVDITNDICELLRKAKDNEFAEFDPVYPDFARVAREEGFPEIASSFQQIAEIERSHGSRFAYYADLLEQGKLFVSDSECGWFGTSSRDGKPPAPAPYAAIRRGSSSVWKWPLTAGRGFLQTNHACNVEKADILKRVRRERAVVRVVRVRGQ